MEMKYINKNTMKRHLATFLFAIIAITLRAQMASSPYYFRTFDSDNGLSNNSVNVVTQDRNGLMYFGTKDGLNLYNGISSRTFRKENSALGNNFIMALYEDEDGRMWIGTDEGAYIYDATSDSFESFHQLTTKSGEETLTHAIPFISQAPDGNIVLSCNEQGLYFYNVKAKTLKHMSLKHGGRELHANVSHVWFEPRSKGSRMWIALYEDNLYYSDFAAGHGVCQPFRAADGSQPFQGLEINCQLEGTHNCTFVGTNRGLYEINHNTNVVRRILSEYVRSCTLDETGNLWIGTEKGLFILNTSDNSLQHITSNHLPDEFSLSDNAIYSIYRDRENGMWIGTYFGGVNYYNSQNSVFRKVYPNEHTPHFGKRVRELLAEGDGTIWVGTEDRGLFRYNPVSGSIQPFTHPDLYPNIHGLCKIGDELWVGTFSGGLCRINTRTQSLRHYSQGSGSGQLATRSVFCICHTSTGDILLGTIGGIFRYRQADDSFEILNDLYGNFVYDILEDHQGNLWFATYNNGVYCRSVRTGHIDHFVPKDDDSNSLPYSKVIGLFEDSHHNIWMATQGGGCCCYNLRTGQFTRYGTKEGLPSNVVLSIVEDTHGNMWLTTNQGLVCLNPTSGEQCFFSKANGLLSNQFNYRSGMVDANGNIYLGTTNGLVVFNPQEFRPSPFFGEGQGETPTLVVSDFYIFDTRATVGKKDSPLQQSILFCDKVNLRAGQNTFSLRASVMSYQSPEMNQILYRLEGLENEWQTLSGTDLIHYAELRYGTYKLHIKGRDCNGRETEERIISIRIHPPFYLTIWAYLFYVCIIAGGAFMAYRYTHGRTLRKHKEAMEKLRREKERELYDAKIEFFTNVAHEIRTPLTLIKNPLENVLASHDVTPAMRDDLETMTMNTDRLLGLVNELLDFRKTESKGFQMHFHTTDVAKLLRKTHTRFAPLARYRSVRFDYDCPETLMARLDEEGFTKILSNLFNNAIKYSETYVHITLRQVSGSDANGGKEEIEVSVQNDGPIVPINMREDIFQSFKRYHDDQTARPIGTGIGLTLARSLAELHGGSLAMDDDLTVNRFVLRVPSDHVETEQESQGSLRSAEQPNAVSADEDTVSDHPVYTLLVVEDNLEMQAFIRRQLVQHYHVITADNGQQALEVLDSEEVHLIVSDVMMPVMDGIELCHRIKSDLNYSHIPVILLTARVGVQATIHGLQQGADAYIEKPFSTDYLLAIIENLLRSREQLKKAFRNSPDTSTSDIGISQPDDDFLKHLHAITLDNMKNSDFSIDQMAAAMAMSRSSLNRKIRAILDLSPGDYIRIERLKYAAELLTSGKYKINEVCYMTGFNTPSYFAKCFQKQFGVLPNEYKGMS